MALTRSASRRSSSSFLAAASRASRSIFCASRLAASSLAFRSPSNLHQLKPAAAPPRRTLFLVFGLLLSVPRKLGLPLALLPLSVVRLVLELLEPRLLLQVALEGLALLGVASLPLGLGLLCRPFGVLLRLERRSGSGRLLGRQLLGLLAQPVRFLLFFLSPATQTCLSRWYRYSSRTHFFLSFFFCASLAFLASFSAAATSSASSSRSSCACRSCATCIRALIPSDCMDHRAHLFAVGLEDALLEHAGGKDLEHAPALFHALLVGVRSVVVVFVLCNWAPTLSQRLKTGPNAPPPRPPPPLHRPHNRRPSPRSPPPTRPRSCRRPRARAGSACPRGSPSSRGTFARRS
jgi:hypothetical protein